MLSRVRVHTFADFQVNGVINVLGQFLAASSLLKNKSLEMEYQDRGQLLQSHPPTDLNLKTRTKGRAVRERTVIAINYLRVHL